MRLRGGGSVFEFGVCVSGVTGGAERGEDWAALTATTAPREPDTAQLVAAERLGLFTYPHATDNDCVKGHAA